MKAYGYPDTACLTRDRISTLNTRAAISDDELAVVNRMRQSMAVGTYWITPFEDCDKSRTIGTMIDNPTITYRDGYGAGRSVIDTESMLRNVPSHANSKNRVRRQERPFVTVPYMGRGRTDPYVESMLQQSEIVRENKSCSTVTDKPFMNQFTPMIPHVQKHVQNSLHIITEDAQRGWIRGGMPSRNYIKDSSC